MDDRRDAKAGLDLADDSAGFLAALSHELRNPLSGIETALAVIESAPLDPRLTRALGVLHRQSAALRRLAEQLTDLSQIMAGSLELSRDRTDLGAALARAEAEAEAAGEFRLRALQLDRQLPAEPLWVMADPVRLAQVFVHLLTHAAHSSQPGGVIHVRAAADGTDLRVDIADEGAGLDNADLQHLFSCRIAAAAQPGKSRRLRLGVAIARSLVQLHGGRIEAASDGRDKGSTLSVWFPRAG
jgi:signal transduction histidine kinase